MHVKKGDQVIITSGKERGRIGEILRVLPNENRVIVEGCNLVKKHVRGNEVLGTESHIHETEAPIHASNVSLYSEQKDGPVRTQIRFVGENGELFAEAKSARESFTNPPDRLRKVRYSVQTEEVFE